MIPCPECGAGQGSGDLSEKKHFAQPLPFDPEHDFDFHTHDLQLPPGRGILCLPQEVVLHPEGFVPHPQGQYAAGIHPWWTADADFNLERHLDGLHTLLRHREVVQVGECGLDRLRGASVEAQIRVFEAVVRVAEAHRRPLTLHAVRTFDLLLHLHRRLHPTTVWTIHGFRGGPALARQLLDAGFDLSFGARFHPEAFAVTPPTRRHRETDFCGGGQP